MAACAPCTHDPGRAEEILDETGPPALTLAAAGQRALANQVAADLTAVGAAVTVVDDGPADLTLRTVSPSAPTDAAGLLSAYALPGTDPPAGFSTTVDLLARSEVTADPAERLDLARRAEEQAMAGVEVIPLLEHRRVAMLGPGTQGLDLNVLGTVDLAQVSRPSS